LNERKLQQQEDDGEDVIKENTDQTYSFVDEFLEKAMKSSSIYE
jgi:hypothetical protein